jgi:hypothetical protein
MKGWTSLVGDIFVSAMIVLFLLVVAFFLLRIVGSLGRGSWVSKVASTVGHAATPSGT